MFFFSLHIIKEHPVFDLYYLFINDERDLSNFEPCDICLSSRAKLQKFCSNEQKIATNTFCGAQICAELFNCDWMQTICLRLLHTNLSCDDLTML